MGYTNTHASGIHNCDLNKVMVSHTNVESLLSTQPCQSCSHDLMFYSKEKYKQQNNRFTHHILNTAPACCWSSSFI